MLNKLLRYEWKTTARILLPVGGGVLALTVVTGLANLLLNSQQNLPSMVEFFQALLNFVVMLALIFVVAACVFVNVQRFYKLLGEQGYLMLSLPVPAWQHIAARLISAMIWSVVGVFYLILCGSILGGGLVHINWNLGNGVQPLSPEGVVLTVVLVLFLLLLLAGAYLEFYLACAIGGQFGQQRLLASIISYFVLGFVEQVLLIVVVVAVLFGTVQAGTGGWLEPMILENSAWLAAGTMAAVLLGLALVDAIKWAITQWLITRRLNLA